MKNEDITPEEIERLIRKYRKEGDEIGITDIFTKLLRYEYLNSYTAQSVAFEDDTEEYKRYTYRAIFLDRVQRQENFLTSIINEIYSDYNFMELLTERLERCKDVAFFLNRGGNGEEDRILREINKLESRILQGGDGKYKADEKELLRGIISAKTEYDRISVTMKSLQEAYKDSISVLGESIEERIEKKTKHYINKASYYIDTFADLITYVLSLYTVIPEGIEDEEEEKLRKDVASLKIVRFTDIEKDISEYRRFLVYYGGDNVYIWQKLIQKEA